jgi:hypothetical protein
MATLLTRRLCPCRDRPPLSRRLTRLTQLQARLLTEAALSPLPRQPFSGLAHAARKHAWNLCEMEAHYHALLKGVPISKL